jgi:hypothetical protein
MWLALRESFGRQRRLRERLITFPLYLFLAIWSVGFGYGYWWSVISGPETTRTGLTGLQEAVSVASTAIGARLDAVRSQLNSVVTWSDGQMAREETSGGSCGTASNAGRGPIYNARRNVRDAVATMRDSMDQSWFKPVAADIAALHQSSAEFGGPSVAARQQRFDAAASQIRSTAQSFAARSNEFGRSYAGEMRTLAQTASTASGAASFACYDPVLAERLRRTADVASQPAELHLHDVTFNEGSAGVANAVKRLWSTIGFYAANLGNSVLPDDAKLPTVTTHETLTGRDLIALLAAIGVDLGLLALAALNPSTYSPKRHHGLSAIHANLKLPALSATEALRAAIKIAVMAAPGTHLDWVRQHLIHHDGASYFVIPSLHAVDANDRDAELRAVAINQLAGVLVDLKLVRGVSETAMRQHGRSANAGELSQSNASSDQAHGGRAVRLLDLFVGKAQTATPSLQNRGLIARARRALAIAGWSTAAASDVELFKLSSNEGITPLLALLNEKTIEHDKTAQDQGPLALTPMPADDTDATTAFGKASTVRSSKALSLVSKS